MHSLRLCTKEGTALIFLLATIIMVFVLSGVMASLVLNQTRFSHHEISRVRAYYVALAAMNLARDNLRTGVWTGGGSTYTLCNDISCDAYDYDMPYQATITINDDTDPAHPNAYILRIAVDYTLTLP